jgi:hypothetical protein
MATLGATDAEIAHAIGINTSTFWRWKGTHVDFCNALRAGQAEADDRVERSLYQRAVGYSFNAVKIGAYGTVPYVEHVPPDTTACVFWLKNRRRDDWRDKSENTTTLNAGEGFGELMAFINGRTRSI